MIPPREWPAGLYDQPAIYRAAFSYRDVAAEVAQMISWFVQSRNVYPKTVLDLGAGPGAHAIEFARRGIAPTLVDSSKEMLQFATRQGKVRRVRLNAVLADMLDFKLSTKFDLAILMLDSASHITSFQGMVDHLRCVAKHLNHGGIYIIEFGLPPGRTEETPKTRSKWTSRLGRMTVSIEWRAKAGTFRNPLYQANVRGVATIDDRRVRFCSTFALRTWSRRAIHAALKMTPFNCIATYGAFCDIPIQHDLAWRMIYVLQKPAHSRVVPIGA
jgi:SAM-dependent methyltransferase